MPQLVGAAAGELTDLRQAVFAAAGGLPERGWPSVSGPRMRSSAQQAAGTFAGYGVDVRAGLSPRRRRRRATCRCAR